MFGFDPLTAGTLMLLASGGDCAAPKPAEINVRPRTAEVRIVSDRPLAALQTAQIDTINPHGFGEDSSIQAFMEGKIAMKPQVKLDYRQDPATGAVCLWYERIDIDIAIDPAIYIASEVYANNCRRAATLEHEKKHVSTDRKIVNKYAALMGQKVFDALKERGFTAGPIPAERAQDAADRMQKTVFQVIEHEYKKMELERLDAQRAVDTKEEYDRVDALCR